MLMLGTFLALVAAGTAVASAAPLTASAGSADSAAGPVAVVRVIPPQPTTMAGD